MKSKHEEKANAFDFNAEKEKVIEEKLKEGTKAVYNMDYETALIHFNKVIFYDKNIPEVYAEKAEIYIKLCDFSSAI